MIPARLTSVPAGVQSGGLGSYGLYGYQPERVTPTIGNTRALADRPFAVNLWMP